LAQHIAAEAMTSGLYEQHVRRLCESYRAKRDAMLAAMEKYVPASAGISWTRPAGGLYIWVTLPEGSDSSRGSGLFKRCVENGALYVPGDYCFQPEETGFVPRNHLRLSFGQVAPDQIDAGIGRIAKALGCGVDAARRAAPAPLNSPA
jgi:DNA-binding transcriptional MocR family regulator